jgi:hypothetical protein
MIRVIPKEKSGLPYNVKYDSAGFRVIDGVIYTFYSMAGPIMGQFTMTVNGEVSNKCAYECDKDLDKLIDYIKNLKRERV